MATHQTPVQVAPATSPAAPLRSLGERALRWISGADRREHEAAEQTRMQVGQTAARERAQAEVQAQAERERQAQAERAAAQAEAAREAQRESVRVAAASQESLIYIITPTGGQFYVARDAWLAARKSKSIDVPLCDWRGNPPADGERTKLRLATIEASVLSPRQIISVAEYLSQPQEDEPTLSI